MLEETMQRLDDALREAGWPERAEQEAVYLRSELVHYGTPVPDIRAAIRSLLRDRKDLGHDELMAIADALWSRPAEAPVHERRLAAAVLLAARPQWLELGDVPAIEGMIRQARTWALVDVLSGDAIGPAFDLNPDQAGVTAVLDRWAQDDDLWVRRSALLAHQRPLRAGQGDWERFARYADAMLDEREFFIRKAIGWVLREASRHRADVVFEWLLPRAERAPGVTVREAVKYLSEEQRDQVLSRRR